MTPVSPNREWIVVDDRVNLTGPGGWGTRSSKRSTFDRISR